MYRQLIPIGLAVVLILAAIPRSADPSFMEDQGRDRNKGAEVAGKSLVYGGEHFVEDGEIWTRQYTGLTNHLDGYANGSEEYATDEAAPMILEADGGGSGLLAAEEEAGHAKGFVRLDRLRYEDDRRVGVTSSSADASVLSQRAGQMVAGGQPMQIEADLLPMGAAMNEMNPLTFTSGAALALNVSGESPSTTEYEDGEGEQEDSLPQLSIEEMNSVAKLAPADLPVTAVPGAAVGTTALTATPGIGNHLVLVVSSSSIVPPAVGDGVPVGEGVIDPYTSGTDLVGVDPITNNYVGVYEVDGSGQIISFRELTLTEELIKPADSSISPATASFSNNADQTSSGLEEGLAVTVGWNGNMLNDILLDGVSMEPTNYEITGNIVTFKKELLAALTDGVHQFTFDMNVGADPTLTLTVSNSAKAIPAAPTLQPAEADDAKVTIRWSPVTDATGYKLFVSTAAGTYGAEADTVSESVYSYVFTGLTNGQTYYFMVKAMNPGGDSAASNEVYATPQAPASEAPVLQDVYGDRVSLRGTPVADAPSNEIAITPAIVS